MSNDRFSYNIDIVFCIDVTGSMSPVLDVVKSNALKFPDDLNRTLQSKEKQVNQVRVRVIAFGDLAVDANPLNASEFMTVIPDHETPQFKAFVDSLKATGGGDIPESGLEALGMAMASDWVNDGDKQRHVIVMFTDAPAHRLEDRVGELPAQVAGAMPSSIDDITDSWESGQTEHAPKLIDRARRLVIFAPDDYPWNSIGVSWAQTVFFPSKAGDGLREVDYSQILEVVSSTI